MAADQRKRRLSSATAFGYGLQEQYRTKRKDFRSRQYDFNGNSHVSLKWDDNGKRVVAKEEQTGISWRHLSSFVPTPPCSNTKLADVLTLPKEVFNLNDFANVLSYEVWHSLLTEKERNYLMQFLPQGSKPGEVVQTLLAGDNFHFGNPFLKWGASVCSGDLHPDAIVHHEKSFKATKKAYYSELQQYHDNMIRNLQKLKERFASSKNPEAAILQMSRSRRHAEKKTLPDANGFKSRRPEENVAAMSEPLSSTADEKFYFSDDQKLSSIRDAKVQKRIHNDYVMKDRHDKLTTPTDSIKALPKSKKAEKPQKANINSDDGAKYMSYMKISKKQHELVKSMKQSGSSIQSKTLNRVLGNLDSSNVKPYEMFVEEEQKRIHEYWSNLATKDVPAAFHNWINGQSGRREVVKSLLHEMEEKLWSLTKEKLVDDGLDLQAQDENLGNYGLHLQAQDEKLFGSHDEETMDPLDMDRESSEGASDHHQDDDTATQGSISDNDKESDPSFMQHESSVHSPSFNVNEGFEPSLIENHCSVQNVPLNINEEFKSMDLNVESNNVTSGTSDTCSTMPEHHPAPETTEACLNASEPSQSSVNNVWTSIRLPESYHNTPKPARLIDLESDLPEEDATKDLLNRHTNHSPFFNPYPNRDRSELLHSVIKRDTYHEELKKTGLDFHPTANILLDPSQFPSHFQEQLQPSFAVDNRQKVQNELFMNHNIQDIYSDSRYPIHGQKGHFTTLNVRDWSNPSVVSTPAIQQSQLLNHNWFASEKQTHGGWSSSDGTVFSTPSLGSGSSGDQSLYSVLSQCNTFHSRAPYNPIPVGSTPQIMPPANYRQDIGGGIPMTSNVLPQMGTPFDYLSGNDTAATSKNTNMGWMSLGNQTPGLPDPSGKPFLKSWNL